MADTFRLVRPDDLFVGTVELENLVLAPDGSELVRVVGGEPAAVVLRLPPQHYLEPAIHERNADVVRHHLGLAAPPALAVPLLASGGARFEWTVPDGVPRVEIGAGPAGFFEAMSRLPTSPGGTLYDALVNLGFGALDLRWALPSSPQPGATRHPLWRIRPDVPPGTTFPSGSPLHVPVPQRLDAVLVFPGEDPGFARRFLEEMGLPDEPLGVTLSNPFPFFMRRYLVRDLTATALGGTMSFVGPLPPPDGSPDPSAWTYEHRTSLGRDVYVRSAQWGWLSSGHRAVVVQIGERVVRAAQLVGRGGQPGAVTTSAAVVAHAELVVTEPVLDLAAHAHEYRHGGREVLFRTLRVGPERTEVDVTDAPGAVRRLTRGGTPLVFDLTGVDQAGRPVHLRMPLAFLPDGRPASDLAGLVPPTGTAAALHPTAVALAPEAGRPPGSTSITIAGLGLAVAAGSSRPVLPTVGSLRVGLDALAGLTDRVPEVAATLHRTFLESGLDRAANPLGTMLAIEPVTLRLPTAGIGGVGNPGGVVDLVTAERGAVAAALASGPPSLQQIAAAFPLPKLLGTIDLLKLLDASSFPTVGGLPSMPTLTRSGPPGAETLTYRFDAALTRSIPDLGIHVEQGARLVLDARLARGGPSGVVATSTGTVTGLRFELAGIVRLRFRRIRFVTDAGGKTTVDVEGVAVDFLGAFEFLAEIARRLAGLTGGTGPRVDVDENGVTAGFQLAIPTLSMGVMQLSNLTIAAFLRIPLADAPLSFTLDVAGRDRPFRATVSLFGGGGFLSLEATPSGLRRLEASIEFGGSMSLDIVVASGGVSVMAGIYFGLKKVGTSQELAFEAFVRASGHLTVLGIVSIFVEFRLALQYRQVTVGGSTHAAFSGTASVTVGVKVLFFSKSVTLTVTREFLGSAADPSFAECVDHDDWDAYCRAFAGVGAPAVAGAAFGGGGHA